MDLEEFKKKKEMENNKNKKIQEIKETTIEDVNIEINNITQAHDIEANIKEYERRKEKKESIQSTLLKVLESEIKNTPELIQDIGENLGMGKDKTVQEVLVTNTVQKMMLDPTIKNLNDLREMVKDDERHKKEEEKEVFLPSHLIADVYLPTWRDKIYREMVDKKNRDKPCNIEIFRIGGRGSGKSTQTANEIVTIMLNDPNISTLITRNYKKELKDSVIAEIIKALDRLNFKEGEDYDWKKQENRIIFTKTGQTIYFEGGEELVNYKGLKPIKGYIGIVWFEEADQFNSVDVFKTVEATAFRGDKSLVYKTYNPPKTNLNWINEYVLELEERMEQNPEDDTLQNIIIERTTYKDLPDYWLGKAFIENAEKLKKLNPKSYEHQYEGKPINISDKLFDNIEIVNIPNEFIMNNINTIYTRYGLDIGYKDPMAFTVVKYVPEEHGIYILDEYCKSEEDLKQLTIEVMENKGYRSINPKIISDSNDARTNSVLKGKYFWNITPVKKVPNSLKDSFRWLESLNYIRIDRKRTPTVYKEMYNAKLPLNKEGKVIEDYSRIGDDHTIASIRYACMDLVHSLYSSR